MGIQIPNLLRNANPKEQLHKTANGGKVKSGSNFHLDFAWESDPDWTLDPSPDFR